MTWISNTLPVLAYLVGKGSDGSLRDILRFVEETGVSVAFYHMLAMDAVLVNTDWQEDVERNCETAFGTDFIVTAKDAMSRYPEIRSELISLKTFSFTNPGYDFPDWRVDVLNKMKDFQIRRILSC